MRLAVAVCLIVANLMVPVDGFERTVTFAELPQYVLEQDLDVGTPVPGPAESPSDAPDGRRVDRFAVRRPRA